MRKQHVDQNSYRIISDQVKSERSARKNGQSYFLVPNIREVIVVGHESTSEKYAADVQWHWQLSSGDFCFWTHVGFWYRYGACLLKICHDPIRSSFEMLNGLRTK